MRIRKFANIFAKRTSNLGSVNRNMVIWFGIIALTGYLISTEGYIYLALMGFAILVLISYYVNLEIALVYLLIISLPFRNFELFPLNMLIAAGGEVPIHSSHILAVMLIVLVCIKMLSNIGKIKLSPIGKMIFLLVSIYAISIVGVFQAHQNFTEYFKSVANVSLFGLLFFAFTNSIRGHQMVIKIIKFWILISLLTALYGFYQLLSYFFISLPIIPGTEIMEYGGIPRVSSIVKEPVPFIQFLIYPVIFMTVLVGARQRFPFKTGKKNILLLGILLTALILSFSLTAILYLLIFWFFFILYDLISSEGTIRKIKLAVLMGGGFLIAVLFMNVGQGFLSRSGAVLTLADSSTRWRVQTLSIGWEEFLKYPLFGIGAGNFPSYTATGIFPEAIFNYEVQHSDTLVFQILAELGIAGAIGVTLFFGTLLKSLGKVVRLNSARDLNFHISRGLFFMMLTYVTSTLVISGWLEFWAWFNFALVGTWVFFETMRLEGMSPISQTTKL